MTAFADMTILMSVFTITTQSLRRNDIKGLLQRAHMPYHLFSSLLDFLSKLKPAMMKVSAAIGPTR
jgi:hypothetical protein